MKTNLVRRTAAMLLALIMLVPAAAYSEDVTISLEDIASDYVEAQVESEGTAPLENESETSAEYDYIRILNNSNVDGYDLEAGSLALLVEEGKAAFVFDNKIVLVDADKLETESVDYDAALDEMMDAACLLYNDDVNWPLPSTVTDGFDITDEMAEGKAGNSMKVSPESVTLVVKETCTLEVSGFTPVSKKDKLLYKSSDAKIAKVDAKGRITAVKAGETFITAYSSADPTISAVCAVAVKAAPTGVKLENKAEKVLIGKTITLKATIVGTDWPCALEWISGDKGKYVKLSAKGNTCDVSGIATGKATITVKTPNGKSAKVAVTVEDPSIPTGIRLNVEPIIAHDLNTPLKLEATLLPEDSAKGSVSWKSSSKKIADVDKDGNVIFYKTGKATITATATTGKKPSAKVTLNITDSRAPNGIQLDPAKPEPIDLNDTLEIIATLLPKETAVGDIEWKSSSPKIATVENGVVIPQKAGTVTITATVTKNKKINAKVKVTIKDLHEPTGVIIDQGTSSQVVVGADLQLTASATAANGYDPITTYEWKSSNARIATVSKDGVVHGVKEGTATITVTTRNKKKATCKITVKKEGITPEAPLLISNLTVNNHENTLGSQITWYVTTTGGKEPLSYKWEIYCDGALENTVSTKEPTVSYMPKQEGNYTVKICVADNNKKSAELAGAEVIVTGASSENIKDYTFEVLNGTYCAITGYIGNDSKIKLPTTDGNGHIVQEIGSEAFSGKKMLTSVIISNTIETIGYSSFENCTGLTSITLPDGIETIEAYAFESCTALTSVHIPDSVKVLSTGAFGRCKNLSNINYPKNWDGGGSPFTDCPKVTTISIPKGVKKIPAYAFSGMGSLKSVELPDSLVLIDYAAFCDCTGLLSIYIPDSVTEIDSSAFEGHSDALTIYGIAGSPAEKYAKEKSINFDTNWTPGESDAFSIEHEIKGVVLAQGSISGSFEMSGTAYNSATSKLKITTDCAWTVSVNDESWMTVKKLDDTECLLTVEDVHDGRTYSSFLTFIVDETKEYKVFVTLDKTHILEELLIPDSTEETVMKANTKALQDAIDDASIDDGKQGIIYLPMGTFYFAQGGKYARSSESGYVIMCRNNVKLIGEGMGNTILKPKGTEVHGIDMFYFNDYEDKKVANYLVDADFERFTVDGKEADNSGSYDSVGKGFMINLLKDCDWNNVRVINTIGSGFGVDCPIDCTFTDCIAEKCGTKADWSGHGGSGFGIGTGYSPDESITIKNCKSSYNQKFGFFFEHQSRFNPEYPDKYKAESGKYFKVINCEATDNLFNFGGLLANDVTYTECKSIYNDVNEVLPNSNHRTRQQLVDYGRNKGEKSKEGLPESVKDDHGIYFGEGKLASKRCSFEGEYKLGNNPFISITW